jgi:arylsulphatase A
VVDDGYADRAEELLNGHSPAGPFRGNKYSSFEGGTAIPAIVSWKKGVKGGQQSNILMSQIDWLASLAQLVGARLPKGAASDSEARLGNLLGTDTEGRPWVIEQSNTRVLSVRTPQWKFIEPSDGEKMISWGPKIETGNNPTPQLYDLSKEVYEKDNVAKENPDVVYELQNVLRRERAKKR